jgi:hypothetical protein
MKLGKVITYVVILVALASYLYFFEIRHRAAKEAAKEEAAKIVQLQEDHVVEMLLESPDRGKIELKKIENVWVLNEPVKVKADERSVSTLLTSASKAQSEKVLAEKDVNWQEYGLDKPRFSLTLITRDKKIEFLFGESNPAKTSYYLRVEGDPRLYLVADTLKNSLDRSAFDLRDKTVLALAPSDVIRFAVTKKDQETEFQRETADKWLMIKPERIRVKSMPVERGLIALTNLSAREIIDNPKTDGDPYGLEQPEESISLAGNDRQQTLIIGKALPKKDVPGPGPDRYARVKGQDTVYVIDPGVLKAIATDPNQLRDRTVLDFKSADVERVDVELDGKKWSVIRNKDGKWALEEPEKKNLTDALPVTTILWGLKELEWKSLKKAGSVDLPSLYLDRPRLILSLFVKGNETPLVMKAGWPPDETKTSQSGAGESAGLTQPDKNKGEADTKKNGGEVTLPEKPVGPETVNILVDQPDEKGAVLEVGGKFVEQLKGDLVKLSTK